MQRYLSIFNATILLFIISCASSSIKTSNEIYLEILQNNITINDSAIGSYQIDNLIIKKNEFDSGSHYQISYFENLVAISRNLTKTELDKMAIDQKHSLKADILVLSSKSDTIPFSKNYLDYVDAEIVIILIEEVSTISDEMLRFLGLAKRCEIIKCHKDAKFKFRGNGYYWEKVL